MPRKPSLSQTAGLFERCSFLPHALTAPIAIALLFSLATAAWTPLAGAAEESDYAPLWRKAIDAYQAEDYQRALETWSQMAKEPRWLSAALYYNMGNTWRMLGKDGKAAWFYEKALKIDPHADDARDNLRLIRAEHPQPVSQPILISRFFGWIASGLTAGEWAGLVFVLYSIAALAGASRPLLAASRKRFAAGVISLAFGVGACVAAAFFIPRYIDAENRQYAVVIEPDAIVRNAPGRTNEESAYFEALEGERFEVREAGLAGWMRVKKTEDGRVGYLPEKSLGLI